MEFEFVVETQHKRGINRNKSATIRKRASKNGAITRKKHGHAKVNPIQFPAFLNPKRTIEVVNQNSIYVDESSPDNVLQEITEPLEDSNDSTDDDLDLIPGPLIMSNHHSIAVRSLAYLADLNVQSRILDQVFGASITPNRHRTAKALYLTQKPVLQKLSLLYGYSNYLDDAVDCIWEVIESRLTSQEPWNYSSKRYNRALNGLQHALGKSKESALYLWYTTLVLALFELLYNSNDHAWVLHARGSVRILSHIGPTGIVNDVHMTLFFAQSKAMVSECIIRLYDCFLAKPEWQDALRRSILPGDSERSEVNVTLWMLSSRIPGLFHRVYQTVLGNMNDLDLSPELVELLSNYQSWWNKYENSESLLMDTVTTFFEHFAITCRLAAAMIPETCLEFETNAIRSAKRILSDETPRIHLRLATVVAKSVISTTWKWTHQIEKYSTIPPSTFREWCIMMGCKLPDTSTIV